MQKNIDKIVDFSGDKKHRNTLQDQVSDILQIIEKSAKL